MKSYTPGQTPLREIAGILQGAVAPRPIALVSTIDEDGNPNLSPFSFFNIFGVNPPIFVFSPSRRARDNTTKHTYYNIKAVPQVVINLVNYDMVHQINLASAEFGKGVNEFIKAGFTMLKSDLVKPFRVKESLVQIECIVRQVIETADTPGAGNLVICEGIKIHVDETILKENGGIDQQKTRWIGRLGENFYTLASGDALFEVPKPLDMASYGIDSLPESIRNSTVFTGNDLGLMGNIIAFPSMEVILEMQNDETFMHILQTENDKIKRREKLHLYAKELLKKDEVIKAIAICIEK
ncbi:MAG: flavin reductase family protein [Bacteroidetes bacterium]|nr:flavin reductase family protein [Bacteroidota bacterium]